MDALAFPAPLAAGNATPLGGAGTRLTAARGGCRSCLWGGMSHAKHGHRVGAE